MFLRSYKKRPGERGGSALREIIEGCDLCETEGSCDLSEIEGNLDFFDNEEHDSTSCNSCEIEGCNSRKNETEALENESCGFCGCISIEGCDSREII
jgi:hypothetical protein